MSQHLVVAIVQLLLAATFLVIPIVARRHGDTAQRAAEARLRSQGFAAELLAKHNIRFTESRAEMLFPFAIALLMAALAMLNLSGAEIGRILSLVAQPVLLLGGGIITAGQVFATRFTESALRKSGDPAVRGLDVPAFIDAAKAAFPGWLRPVIIARFVLVTVGSLLVVILLVVA